MRSQLKREIISVVLNGERVLFVRQQKQKGKTKKNAPKSLYYNCPQQESIGEPAGQQHNTCKRCFVVFGFVLMLLDRVQCEPLTKHPSPHIQITNTLAFLYLYVYFLIFIYIYSICVSIHLYMHVNIAIQIYL